MRYIQLLTTAEDELGNLGDPFYSCANSEHKI